MRIDVQDRSGVHVVRVCGASLDEHQTLVKAVTDLLGTRGARIVIDLSEVKWIDSTGLSALVTMTAKGNQRESHVLLAVPVFIRGVLETTRLDRFLRVHPTVEAAVASLG